MTVTALAPAKINLALHVTGQRDDRYHLLDSIVVFGPIADRLTISEASAFSFRLEGPQDTGLPVDNKNLVVRAAKLAAPDVNLRITLEKMLPVAAGIGGGSSDAAASIRGILELLHGEGNVPKLVSRLEHEALQLGADVPVCLFARSARMRGIGESIEFLDLPELYAVLANPGVQISTPDIFKNLPNKDNPAMPATLPVFESSGEFLDWLQCQRNDLQGPAIDQNPVVGDVIEELLNLRRSRLARMSGSGATCFTLFDDLDDARAAEETLGQRHPDWWVASGKLGNSRDWSV